MSHIEVRSQALVPRRQQVLDRGKRRRLNEIDHHRGRKHVHLAAADARCGVLLAYNNLRASLRAGLDRFHGGHYNSSRRGTTSREGIAMRSNLALQRIFFDVAAALAASAALAWPTKPVTFLVPYPPGGGTDVIARIVQEPLSKQLGQPIVIENRGGAGGSLGTGVAAKAVPDGHTLLFTLSSHSINPAIYKSLPFDTERDFRPISTICSLPQLFAVHPGTPYRKFSELVEYIKGHPGRIDYASVGVGSPSHMAGELLELKLRAHMVHIPYRGGGPAVAATMAGDVPLLIVSIPAAMSQVRSGRLRPLAVRTKKRPPLRPNVPTIADATGLGDYDANSRHAVLPPAT